MARFPGDQLGAGGSIIFGFMRKHWPMDAVADRQYAGNVRAEMIGEDEAALIQRHARLLKAEPRRVRPATDREQNDIRFDLERVIAALPEDLQDLCEKLQSSNMAEIAREMGVPRSTLYGKLTKLRDAFRDGGLEEYL